MRIRSLRLRSFRSYNRFETSFGPHLNLITGPNGIGKTNLLEAIDVCATGRSHRAHREAEVIRFGAEWTSVRAEWERGRSTHASEVRIERAGLKHIRVNATRTSRAELLGKAVLVFSGPDDTKIVAGGSAHRRQLIDAMLCQLSPSYYNNLLRYGRVLTQRNRLLRASAPVTLLEAWDEQLIELGGSISDRRAEFIDRIAPLAVESSGALGCARVEVTYRASWNDEADRRTVARQTLTRSRREEFARGVTVSGPHRDDVEIFSGGIPARTFGSRGQQRATLLSLRLAEREIVRQETGEDPIMLFDDVLSDLDAERVRSLLDVMGNGSQVLLTATDRLEVSLPDAHHIDVSAVAPSRAAAHPQHPEAP